MNETHSQHCPVAGQAPDRYQEYLAFRLGNLNMTGLDTKPIPVKHWGYRDQATARFRRRKAAIRGRQTDSGDIWNMLRLSDILISNPDLESFSDLIPLIKQAARDGERFFQMDVKPPYSDTPVDWEERLESEFSGRV